MNLLALETSSAACSVALYSNNQLFSSHRIAPMQQTGLILPMIEELLSSHSLKLSHLNGIAYGVGPGSFTGMRIANSVTQGLAYAANIPVIPVSSLAALACAAHETTKMTDYLLALDARMGGVYWAHYSYTSDETLVLQGEEVLCAPAEVNLPDHINCKNTVVAAGDGWGTYKDVLINTLNYEPNVILSEQLSTAEAVLKLALVKFTQNNVISATEALPSYLIKR